VSVQKNIDAGPDGIHVFPEGNGKGQAIQDYDYEGSQHIKSWILLEGEASPSRFSISTAQLVFRLGTASPSSTGNG
jgi:hypothetical protein